jgi:biopolymer transport protein TolQ
MDQTTPPAVPVGQVTGNALDAMAGQAISTGPGMGAAAHDLSIIGLFMQADWIVKVVMIMLLMASFWSGGSLEELFDRIGNRPPDPMSSIFVSAMREWRRSAAKGLLGSESLRESLQERIERVMGITLGREMDQLERYMTFLASVGSAAPFVGLFGTVWGIMNSFAAIAGSKNTSLAVVAPGIAEALFATALGLVAAIPAVLAYNKLNSDISRYGNRLDAFSGEFGAILSRQLEEKH